MINNVGNWAKHRLYQHSSVLWPTHSLVCCYCPRVPCYSGEEALRPCQRIALALGLSWEEQLEGKLVCPRCPQPPATPRPPTSCIRLVSIRYI